MDLDLKGKNVLVTGSSKGIGYAIASQLYKEGCNVTINGRNQKSLETSILPFNERMNYCMADVTNQNDCERLIKNTIDHWGSIDLLVCNVGNGNSVKPGNENFEEWQKVFFNNFFSTTNVIESITKNTLNSLKSIVCISSIAGVEFTGAPVTYSVAKSAINSYVKNISKHLAKSGTRINAVAPGNIIFDDSIWKKKLSENSNDVEDMLKREVAMGRFGTPEEISNLVVFLCSEKSSFITGSTFIADGGQTKS